MRCLREFSVSGDSILEVGCGSYGLAYFWRKKLTGCDVEFPQKPLKLIRAVVALGSNLPFPDRSFDSVIASDVLEHVRPDQRRAVVQEILRVCRKVAILGFPSGVVAHRVDESLLRDCKRWGITPPKWLLEHMDNPFPDRSLFDGIPAEWKVRSFGNEHVSFHHWMMRKELRGPWNRLFKLLLSLFPSLVEQGLRLADREPYYRLIFVAIRRPSQQARARLNRYTKG